MACRSWWFGFRCRCSRPALMIVLRPTVRSIWVGEIFLPVVVVALVFNFGFRQLTHEPPATRTLHVDARSAEHSANADLGHQPGPGPVPRADPALRAGPDQPDGSAGLAGSGGAQLRPLGHEHLSGHHQPRPPASRLADPRLGRHRPRRGRPTRATATSITTRASSSARTVEFVARYRKRNLVIFGEYIPLVRWLPFVKWFTPIEGGFTPGDRPVPFVLTEAGREDLRADLFRGHLPAPRARIRRRRHRFPGQPHQRRLVRRRRGPMAARRRRALPRRGKRPAARPLLEQRADRLGGLAAAACARCFGTTAAPSMGRGS